MRNTRAKIPVFFIALSVIAACVLRFFILLDFTDKKTGYVVEGTVLPLFLYAVLGVILLFVGLFSKNKTQPSSLLDFEGSSKGECLNYLFLSLSFFIDFIYQGYICYDYLSGTDYIEYVYVIPLIITALLALICCFYFGCAAMTANGSNYDFRNLTVFHFAPVMWGLVRLIMMMLKIIDIRLGVENMLEFLLLSFMMMFFFSFLSMLDNGGAPGKAFIFFALSTFALSVVLVAPRAVIIIMGKSEMLCRVTYSNINYLAIGIFAVTLSKKALTVIKN